MIVSVLGTGYLGATHAACMAALGHTVVAVDVDPAKIASLRAGRVPFHEPGLPELLEAGLASGRLTFTTEVAQAADAEVHFVCVGTPQADDDGTADVSALDAVVHALAPHLRRAALVVGKSTVPVGTAERLRDELRSLAPAGDAVGLAWNPEFLREGSAVDDSLRPSRLVLGVERDADERLLHEVYADVVATGCPVVRTDLPTAELAKVAANAMLATRISFVNLLAEVCEAAGADVGGLTEVLGLDPRIGAQHLQPGLGYGGGCLPKDIRGLAARARELGVEQPLDLLTAVDAVNGWQRERTTRRALRLALEGAALAGAALEGAALDRRGSVGGAPVVGVLGGAFKAGSDDVRDSPALEVASALVEEGLVVHVFDPAAGDNVRRGFPGLDVVDSAEEAAAGAHLLLVATEWPEFRDLDPTALGAVAACPRVLDARLVLDQDAWAEAGWEVHTTGRGPRPAASVDDPATPVPPVVPLVPTQRAHAAVPTVVGRLGA